MDQLEAASMRHLTAARLGIVRSGGSLTTAQVLDFDLAHAQARDAVHLGFDRDQVKSDIQKILAEHGMAPAVLEIHSMAADKAIYLKRPDLGRRLSAESMPRLEQVEQGKDVAVIVSDGLSAQALVHLPAVLRAWLPLVRSAGFSVAPILLIPLARVGISDHVGEIIRPRTSVILLGERPGLATPESLGAYFTHEPRHGRTDADRNCISNIHADGLSAETAAALLQSLVVHAIRLNLGGVLLSQQMAQRDAGPLEC
jgi:ethanolamine ammonia-lyase small subunit